MTRETSVSPLVAEDEGDSASSEFPTRKQVFTLLAFYFAIQVASRTAFSSSIDLDESEAVVLAQKLSIGYSAGPPLYTWLQIPVFAALGQSVFSLSLLKNLLLFATYCLTFEAARLANKNHRVAVAACVSLLLLPNVAWESQRDLTHSVLAAALSVATLWLLIKINQNRGVWWYVAFGTCAGCGLLSKYNYAPWLGGLLLAAVTLPGMRSAVLNTRMVLALAIAMAIFSPFGAWMLQNRELALLSSSKFQVQQSLSWAESVGVGLKSIAQSVLSYTGPLVGVYLAMFFARRGRSGIAVDRTYPHLLLRAWVLILLGLSLGVIFAHATGFKERWFQPIFVTVPIFAATIVQSRLTVSRVRLLLFLAVMVMVVVTVVLPGRLFAAERLRREEPLTRPYAELTKQVRPLVPAGSLLACDTRILAGNLRLNLKDVNVLDPDLPRLFPAGGRRCFLLWDARAQETPPEQLLQWASANGLGTAAQAQYFKAVYRYHKTKEFRIGLLPLH